jgi:predicted metal-binding membrane protein
MPSAVPLGRQRTAILVALLVCSVVAWVWVVRLSRSMSANGMAMDHDIRNRLTIGMGGPVFLGVWVLMMVAMMFPAAAPMFTTFDKLQSGRRDKGRSYVPTAVFVGGYLFVWAVFGLIAYGLALGASALADSHHLRQSVLARVGGAVIALRRRLPAQLMEAPMPFQVPEPVGLRG